MTDGNKTTCRNVLLPTDSNGVAYLPTGSCHIYQDVSYEQLASLEEFKSFLYSCQEMFSHAKKTHCDMHTNRLHFTESQNRGGQEGPLEITSCSPVAPSRAELRAAAQDSVQPPAGIACCLDLGGARCSAPPHRTSVQKSWR